MNLRNIPTSFQSNAAQTNAFNSFNRNDQKSIGTDQNVTNVTKSQSKENPTGKEHAQKVLTNGRVVIKDIMESVAKGQLIDKEAASDVVDDCVQALLSETEALSWLIKMRDADAYTSEHSLNVSILAIAFGQYLQMNLHQLKELGLAGLLHDVGKMLIPEHILNKPGKLTEDERKVIEQHTLYGRDILSDSSVEDYIVDVAYAHHEKVDGTGYPMKKKYGEISEYAKIISLVDFYDALTAERCYKKPLPPSAVLDIIEENSGKYFDSTLAEKFIKFMGMYTIGTIVELRNGLIGLVAKKNETCHYLPQIYVCKKSSEKSSDNHFVDLGRFDQHTLLDRGYLIKTDHPDGYSDIYLEDYIDIVGEEPAEV